MAKLSKKATENEVQVDVVETTTDNQQNVEEVVENTDITTNEDVTVDNQNEDVVEDTTPQVEIPEVTTETTNNDVVVDTEKAEVNNSNRPNGNVKIRMRVDHKCTIAMERYDFKAGKTYTVPANVKRILNKAGLLAPL